MKISIASYAFHGLLAEGCIDLYGYLESCRYRYHLNSADIWNGMLPDPSPEALKPVKRALEERELELANLCVDGAHIWDDDPAQREKYCERAWAYLHAAHILGAKTIRIDAGGQGTEFSSEQFDLIVSQYRQYAQFAWDHGFKVGPENHWGPEVVPANMKAICEAVDHPAFGVLLHFKDAEGDPLIAPWAMHTHISWDITQNCLDESIALLKAHDYQDYWSIEHHSGKNEYANVAVQLAKVQAALNA